MRIKSFVAATLGFLFVSLIGGRVTANEELPDYTVVEELGDNIEVRAYPPMLLAEVVVTGDRDEAANKAFRILADYIFGNNRSRDKVAMTAPVTQTESEKIAMTAPVTQSPEGSGAWTVSFMMPSKYTEETLPQPNNPDIAIRTTEPHKAIAIRFSGRITDRNMEKHKQRLAAMMTERGLKADGPAIYAYYNGPFTPFFLKRNEVIFYLAEG